MEQKDPHKLKTAVAQEKSIGSIKRYIDNFQTKEPLLVVGGEEECFSLKDISQIAKICSQDNKRFMFDEILQGRKYSEEDAIRFVEYAKNGWKNKTHFIFFIRKQNGDIVGSINIKGVSGEIGYWADQNESGFMTNAVLAVSDIAKRDFDLDRLIAWVRVWNTSSIKVLERAGYVKIDEKEHGNMGPSFCFEKVLADKTL